MKILLTGRDGQIGRELGRALAPLGAVSAVDIDEVDLADPDSVRRAVRRLDPDVMVNAAGYTAVDRAEAERDLAMAVNGTAPGVLAEEALRHEALLVHYSTDYVFDGEKDAPYLESDRPRPVNFYGESKLAGENAVRESGCSHLILRTSWVYGLHGRNFLRTILALARDREEIPVVDDQVGAPTWSGALADATARLVERIGGGGQPPGGTYHLTCGGSTSWCGFARAILEETSTRSPDRILPIPTSGYPTAAKRPPNSRLCCDRIRNDFGIALPDWRKSLRQCLGD
jgi:dTDP-4-dehydrorhamnose reductase